MKTIRILTLIAGLIFAWNVKAQNVLSEDAVKAQKGLVEFLRANNIAPSIDTRDNSINFKVDNVLYWVTFDESNPVKYTLHRKGIRFDNDPNFKEVCALAACNEVNSQYPIKCILNDKRVELIMQTYAKEPSHFTGGLKRMVAGFNNSENTFKKAYETRYEKWKQDSIEAARPIAPDRPVMSSPLKVSYIGFANFDGRGNMISDLGQPLRKNDMKYLLTILDVEAPERGLYKLGMKISNPDGKAMVANQGVDYTATANVEIKKPDKPQEVRFETYGSDSPDFWKEGEYKVEIYDYEKGAKIYETTFHLL